MDAIAAMLPTLMVVKLSEQLGPRGTVVKGLFERLPYIAKRADDKSASAKTTKRNAP